VAYDFAMDIAREKQMFVTERMFLELLKACKLKSVRSLQLIIVVCLVRGTNLANGSLGSPYR